MPRFVKLSAFLMLVAACPASAADTSDKDQTQAAADPSQQVICRSQQVTGSWLPGPRICHTKGEWDEMTRQGQEYTRGVQSKFTPPPTK